MTDWGIKQAVNSSPRSCRQEALELGTGAQKVWLQLVTMTQQLHGHWDKEDERTHLALDSVGLSLALICFTQ